MLAKTEIVFFYLLFYFSNFKATKNTILKFTKLFTNVPLLYSIQFPSQNAASHTTIFVSRSLQVFPGLCTIRKDMP